MGLRLPALFTKGDAIFFEVAFGINDSVRMKIQCE
jgi:hypothetical protein